MGLLSNLLGGALEVAMTPIAVVADVVSGGESGHTAKQVEKIADRVQDAVADVQDLDLI